MLALMCITLIGSPGKAATVFLEPHGSLATPGSFDLTVDPVTSFGLDVYISVPEAEHGGHGGFYGAGFYIDFDGSMISANSASVNDPPFDSGWSYIEIGSNYVMYQAMMKMTEKNRHGNILIGTVQFSPQGLGTSMITTRDYSGFPDFVYFDGGSFDDAVVFSNGTVNAVPVPGGLLLLGSGLVGLLGFRRKIRR